MGDVIDITRELQNATSRARRAAELKASKDEIMPLGEMILTYVKAVLAIYEGNKTRTAKALGIDRRAMYRWCAKIEKLEAQNAAPNAAGA